MFTPPADGRPPTTLEEKRQFIVGLLAFPALSVMVFLRRRVGYRQVKPVMLLGTAAGIVVFAPVMGYVRTVAVPRFAFQAVSDPGYFDTPTELFAVAMLVAGLLQRRARWQEICRGVSWHTYSRGVPYLAAVLPLREIDVERFVDPLVCFLMGGVVALVVSSALGAWLMFSAFALLMVEQYAYELHINRELDLLDGMIASDVFRQTAQHFEREGGVKAAEAVPPEKLDATAGIPTGIAPDLQTQVQRRERRAPIE